MMADTAQMVVGCWAMFDDGGVYIGHTHEVIYAGELGGRGFTIPCHECLARDDVVLAYNGRVPVSEEGITEKPR